jgi:antitoxin ParD1/3/4
LKIGTDQLDSGEGIAIESKAMLDSLFDDVKS